MKLVASLVVVGALGCSTTLDPKKVALLKDEIATLGSVAQLDGTRAPAEKRMIAGFADDMQRHVDELAR